MINVTKVQQAIEASDDNETKAKAAIEEIFRQLLERDRPTDTELLGCEFNEF